MAARLLLARHAETVWHGENRYAGGRSEPGLTDLGHRQAEELAEAATALPVDVLVTSPQRRAVDTAAPTAAALGVTPLVEDDLREIDFGALEGHTLDEMPPDAVARFREDAARHAFPGAEPLADAGARAVRVLRGLDASHDGATVLVVAHSSLFRVALCTLIGVPVGHYRHVFPYLSNTALTEIRLPAAILSLNVPCGQSKEQPGFGASTANG